MSSEKRNRAGIVIVILGLVIFLATTYQLDFALPNTPETLDLRMALTIMWIAGGFLALFGGLIQTMIDS